MAQFKNNKNWERFLCEIDSMPQSNVEEIMGDDYIDTPGSYRDEKGMYDGIVDFMINNMGTREYNRLYNYWLNNVKK